MKNKQSLLARALSKLGFLSGNSAELTDKVVDELQAHMLGHYKAKVLPKGDSMFMHEVASLLSQTGPRINRDTFLTRYGTTIANEIYIPSTMRANFGLLNYVQLIVHECQHVHQSDSLKTEYEVDYLSNPMRRAEFESQAISAASEVRHWLTGQNVTAFVNRECDNLKEYALTPVHINRARDLALDMANLANLGIYMTDAGRTACTYLQRFYPRLKGKVPT